MTEYIDRKVLLENLARFAPECRAALLIVRKQKPIDVGGKWISVADQVPEKGGEYICRCNIDGHDEFPFHMVLRYILIDKNPHFQHEDAHGLRVTHWMPLPEPPEEDHHGQE